MLMNRGTQGGLVLLGAFGLSWMLTGCVAVGYSSRGGWFVWPGGFGLVVVVLLVLFLLLRRR